MEITLFNKWLRQRDEKLFQSPRCPWEASCSHFSDLNVLRKNVLPTPLSLTSSSSSSSPRMREGTNSKCFTLRVGVFFFFWFSLSNLYHWVLLAAFCMADCFCECIPTGVNFFFFHFCLLLILIACLVMVVFWWLCFWLLNGTLALG